MTTHRFLSLAGFLATLALLGIGASPVMAASSSVECGQLASYVAPDPAAPSDGSLQIGQLSAWDILATAIVSPAAQAVLPALAGSAPTCLAVDFDDDGNITALDIAPQGVIAGDVAFDSGAGFYFLADRLIVPDFITDTYPGLAAIVVTSHQAGTVLTMTFTVDPTTGLFAAFDGLAAFCGNGYVTSGGDGQVGDAIIPAAVLDAADIGALTTAGNRTACATVHSTGTVDPLSGTISTSTDVEIAVAAAAGPIFTPPPTSTRQAVAPAPDAGLPALAWLAVIASVAMGSVARRSRTNRR